MRTSLRAAVLSACLLVAQPAVALDSDDLDELLGYTMIEYTNVTGDFEGADFGKVVKLDNGWIFEFQGFSYTYSYHPSVAVFAKQITSKGRDVVIHKLIIDDEIYDATRIR